jgi:hypothetical protein
MNQCILAAMVLCALVVARPSAAQSRLGEVLTFLLTNRSIPTDDLVQDEQAAAASSNAISRILLAELSTLPVSSSGGGFTYRLNPVLGSSVRSSNTFGPFFVERSLTVGKRQTSFGLNYQAATFDRLDGRHLRDGTLVATASVFRGTATPFDVETVTLRLHTTTVTFLGNVGLTDRLDFALLVPLVSLTLSGQRLDTYRGRQSLQATASASASGLGDLVVRAKYNVFRDGGRGLAVAAESRLPTGAKDDLLGTGHATIKPRLIGSIETDRLGAHVDVGYAFGGVSDELDFAGAVTVVGSPRLTLVAEMLGRRLSSIGRLTDTIEPNPRLIGVDVVRLTAVPQATDRIVAVAGLKYNMGATWLLSASVERPITTAGLNAGRVATLTLDYSFGR